MRQGIRATHFPAPCVSRLKGRCLTGRFPERLPIPILASPRRGWAERAEVGEELIQVLFSQDVLTVCWS